MPQVAAPAKSADFTLASKDHSVLVILTIHRPKDNTMNRKPLIIPRESFTTFFMKSDQPGPRTKSKENPIENTLPSELDRRNALFLDLETAYASCKSMAVVLLSDSNNSPKVQSWIDVIDEQLENIRKAREQGNVKRGRY